MGEGPIEPSSKVDRRLVAILAADVAGYSHLMGEDEVSTVRDLKECQAIALPLISDFDGRVIDTAGDGILAEFGSAVAAVECAMRLQSLMSARSVGAAEHRRMRFRIGINLGEVIHDESRIYGADINIAARLENIAEPGGICISVSCRRTPTRSLRFCRARVAHAHCGMTTTCLAGHLSVR